MLKTFEDAVPLRLNTLKAYAKYLRKEIDYLEKRGEQIITEDKKEEIDI